MPSHLLLDILPKADSPGVVPWVAFAVGLGAVAFVYFRSQKLARRRKDPLAKPPLVSSLAQQRSVERQMQGLLVELSEMARQIGAQLDTRAGKLDVLLREADDKLSRLQVASDALANARAKVTEARLSVASQVAAARAAAPPLAAPVVAAESSQPPPPHSEAPLELPVELPLPAPALAQAPAVTPEPSPSEPAIADAPKPEPLPEMPVEFSSHAEPAPAEQPAEQPVEWPPVLPPVSRARVIKPMPAESSKPRAGGYAPAAMKQAQKVAAQIEEQMVAVPSNLISSQPEQKKPDPVHVTAISARSAATSSSSQSPYHPVTLPPPPTLTPPAAAADAERAAQPVEMPHRNGAVCAESQPKTEPASLPPLKSISTNPISAIDAGLANVAALSPEAFGAFDPGEPSPPPHHNPDHNRPDRDGPDRDRLSTQPSPMPPPAPSLPQTFSMSGFSKLPVSNGGDTTQASDSNSPPFRSDGASFGFAAAQAARFGPAKWPKAASDPLPPPMPLRTPAPAPAPSPSSWPGSELLLPTSAPLPPDPRHVAVYQLADQGLTINAIAQQVDRPMGEIELILALRPRQERLA
jgi:hypothetical protein